MPDRTTERARLEPKIAATPPVTDNRNRYGRMFGTMDLPECDTGEVVECSKEVLYCNADYGYPHDQWHAERYLKPGHVYKTKLIEVHQSSSSVELEEFPGVRFNTVLFADVPHPDTALHIEELAGALEESLRYSPYRGESEETPFLRRARAALALVRGAPGGGKEKQS